MKIWFDTEFIEDGTTIDLLSIGLIRADGRTYYAESRDADKSRACDWVKENVFPHLGGSLKSRATIAREILEFVGPNPEFWAYFASYDWVALCQLYGRMVDLPKGWPMFCRDLQQLRVEKNIQELPPNEGNAHNALDDAIWTKKAYEYVMKYKTTQFYSK